MWLPNVSQMCAASTVLLKTTESARALYVSWRKGGRRGKARFRGAQGLGKARHKFKLLHLALRRVKIAAPRALPSNCPMPLAVPPDGASASPVQSASGSASFQDKAHTRVYQGEQFQPYRA